MRIFVLILSSGLVLTGCAKMKSLLPASPNRDRAPAEATAPDVTLAPEPGRVALLDPEARFVVVTFPVGGVPGIDRRLNVYRNTEKVAELKVTGPQRGNNTVADIIFGEVKVNDEVRMD